MAKRGKIWAGGFVIVSILLLLYLSLSDTTSGGKTGTSGSPSDPVMDSDGKTTLDPTKGGWYDGDARVEMSRPVDPKIKLLHDLLDDDSNREQTLALAYVLAEGNEQQQLAAIDAFRWLGGRMAQKALIKLRKTAYPSIATDAGQALTHLLTEGIYTGSSNPLWTKSEDNSQNNAEAEDNKSILTENEGEDSDEDVNFAEIVDFDAAIWEQAILEAPDENDRVELLILMSAFPGTDSIPVLLNLLESSDLQIREHALDYLEFVTYGEKITTRQEGEDWLARNGAMEQLAQ